MRQQAQPIVGFTLIEVLVTLAVIALGLLGLGALQARLQQAELESYDRAQALVLLHAMVNRINANRQTAPCYAVTTGVGTPYLGYVDGGHVGVVSCAGFGDANTQQLAVDDLNNWDQMLQGTIEAVGGRGTGGALAARGCISLDAATGTYTIAVAWQGMSATATPAIDCGNNAYGAETMRRVVSTTFRPARLL